MAKEAERRLYKHTDQLVCSTMAISSRNPDHTRGAILEAAIAVANDGGVGKFTLDAVVARLKVSKGAVMHHFPNKLALLEAMLAGLAEQFVDQVQTIAAQDPDPYGRSARAYLRATVEGVGDDAEINLARVVMIACLLEPSLVELWRKHTAHLLQDDPIDPVGADDALLCRMVADGLWLNDVLKVHPISPDQRQALFHLLTPQSGAQK